MKMYRFVLFLLCSVVAIGLGFGKDAPAASIWTLEDNLLKVVIDASGRIVHLENKTAKQGNVIASPEGLFKMVCKRGENWEDVVFADKQKYNVTKTGNAVKVTVDQVVTRDATSQVGIVMTVSLTNGKLAFEAEINNRQPGLMVTDFIYPQVGVMKTLGGGKPGLLWPNQSGEWFTNIGDMLSQMPETRQAANMKTINYPGNASMQWMALVDRDQCLYFSGRDADFYSSVLRVVGSRHDAGAISLSLNRLSFVKPNERWKCPGSILMLYTGSWRKGADEYRQWASTWRKPEKPPKWVQDMMGYFLVINKQQYGDEMWSYDKLPELYERAKEHGCDVLGLFGWYDSGHDNMYPDIQASPTLGGANALRDNIRKVQQSGGHVTLYSQGHLMDVNAPYYKTTGHKLESKSFWGVPYYEKYNKFNQSDFLNSFTSKTFSTVCPSCTQWHDLMAEKANEVAALGPNGILYDQIGGMVPNPCFDESHPHPHGKPSLSYTNGRLGLLDKIQKETKKINGEYAFFTEHITDVYAQFVDCLHGMRTYPDAVGTRQKLVSAQTPATINYPELYRYCFPNTIITIRNAFPYIRPQVANYALTFGLRYEMELRYLDDVTYVQENQMPEWKKYASAITALRKKYWNILGYGKFIDEELLTNGNRTVITKAYQTQDSLAVVLWNDHSTAQKVNLQVAGYRLAEVAGVQGSTSKLPETMQPQQVLVAVYKKQN